MVPSRKRTSAKIPRESSAATPPSANGVLALDFNYDFKTDLVLAGFLKSQNIDMAKIPYRDPVQALNDVAEGRLHLYVVLGGISSAVRNSRRNWAGTACTPFTTPRLRTSAISSAE